MIAVTTKSADDTRALAGEIAALVIAGDVLLLEGDLGAGKTTFAQGFGAALGIDEPITSPTFTLVRPYAGRLTLQHVDLYRLEDAAEIHDLGLPEVFEGDAVALIEWGERAVGALPADFLEIGIAAGEGDDDRRFTLTAVGHRWMDRVPAITSALERWS